MYDCLILGGGIAGMSAAWTFHKAGIDNYLVLEGRDRVGGRIYSEKKSEGFVAELGAEWIGKTHIELLALIKQINEHEENNDLIKLVDHTFDNSVHLHTSQSSNPTKHIYTMHHERLESFFNQFSGRQDPRIEEIYETYTVEQVIRELYNDTNAIEYEDLENSNEFGESMKTMAASRFIINALCGGKTCHCDYKVSGGNQKICSQITSIIGAEKIHYESSITQIEYTNPGYTIKCSNGKVYTCKKVICTLPVSVWSRIKWINCLSEEKRKIMHSLSYNRVFKGGFVIDNKMLSDDFGVLTDTIVHTIYNTGKSESGSTKKMIGIYSTADRAFLLAKESNDEIFGHLKNEKELSMLTGYEDSYRYYRGEDAFVEGGFAVFAPGQYCSGIRTLGTKEGNCYFAGEHTSMQFQGFMEGGCESGIKAAKMVLAL